MLVLAAVAILSPTCSAQAPAAPPAAAICPGLPAAQNWRRAATEDDRERIREWRDAWIEALETARAAGSGSEIDAAGPLLEPDAALPAPTPPAGDYDCRTIKVGGQTDAMLDFVAYPVFRCRIEISGEGMTLVKLDGSQRPVGRLFADTERRMIFLGTLQLGDERLAYEYGTDRERDLAGMVERIDDRRWRLVFPYPHFESLLDVIELRPRSGAARAEPREGKR